MRAIIKKGNYFLKLLLLAITYFYGIPAYSSVYTANDLLNDCQVSVDYMNHNINATTNPASAGLCIGYLRAFDDMQFEMAYAAANYSDDVNKIEKFRLFCDPEGITYGQESRMVVKYLKDHPETLHNSASSVLVNMLSNYYPCKQK